MRGLPTDFLPQCLLEGVRLPDPVRAILLEAREQLAALNAQLDGCDRQISAYARSRDVAQRASELLGAGPVTASALAAAVLDARVFAMADSSASGSA